MLKSYRGKPWGTCILALRFISFLPCFFSKTQGAGSQQTTYPRFPWQLTPSSVLMMGSPGLNMKGTRGKCYFLVSGVPPAAAAAAVDRSRFGGNSQAGESYSQLWQGCWSNLSSTVFMGSGCGQDGASCGQCQNSKLLPRVCVYTDDFYVRCKWEHVPQSTVKMRQRDMPKTASLNLNVETKKFHWNHLASCFFF